jgi:hypothetical protein
MPRNADARTLASTGATIPTSRTRRARAVLGGAAACCLCRGVATGTDPEDGREWCARDFYRLHAALAYTLNAAAGALPTRAPRPAREVVTRVVPAPATRQAGVATRARGQAPAKPRRAPTGKAAQNAARTECPKGHPFAGDNVRVNTRGGRVCKTCERAARLRNRARRRQEAACAA